MRRGSKKWNEAAGIHLDFLTSERKRMWQEIEDGKPLDRVTLHSAHRIEQHLKELARVCEGVG
jgi:hypothetical protein